MSQLLRPIVANKVHVYLSIVLYGFHNYEGSHHNAVGDGSRRAKGWDAKAIVGHRMESCATGYLVKWAGYPASHNTQDPTVNATSLCHLLSIAFSLRGNIQTRSFLRHDVTGCLQSSSYMPLIEDLAEDEAERKGDAGGTGLVTSSISGFGCVHRQDLPAVAEAVATSGLAVFKEARAAVEEVS
ncbi:hypothetical protein M434DRAFT_38073 [Hypoxylon sp. CO27-5]|nr:hypothetical protein M434DRAFT_38073 [Hypoxylon sp. CO27-5]